MHTLSTLLGRLPIPVRVSLILVLLLLGLYILIMLISPQYQTQTSTSVNTNLQQETAAIPAATPQITRDSKSHYVFLAQQTLTSRQRTDNDLPKGEWKAITVASDNDTALVIVLPLDRQPTNKKFIRVAKQEIVEVINTLFVDAPTLTRIGVVGTFPGEEGEEIPAISIFVNRSASSEWGNLAVDEIEAIAQSVEIKPQFRNP
ncbi:MAG: hypothetical protein GFH27_549279n178 [Chloroflexi bacterium AL-W]|nr:hypothetical protein [Chloroflexi bacterium AL-N1]NOK65144.1 hypothetical protein [Chloroflexi bacterium AL-N10]NOK72589.1 hypothetical protein [Chloroflexi bacterium AL-N5]NOK79323.1 hypothetical protein [Chloroflexi bacterium AL-W]NOK87239.1 hypothetical protein [Chloroflexi bacterium AL-N15]